MLEKHESVGHFYEFDSFRLDASKRLLWHENALVALTPKAFDLLLTLVQHHGTVLEKDEIMRLLWPHLVVEENNLTVMISALRKALGESPAQHKYIVTLPKRGYCFVAQVKEVWCTQLAAVGQIRNSHAPTRRTAVRGATHPPRSLAVLPFRTIGTGLDEDYLGLGLSDALITKLGKLKQIAVRSTGTTLSHTQTWQSPLSIGRKLGVDFLLEGAIQRYEQRIRLTIQLVDVQDGSSLWAEKFDALFSDIFELQDAISEQIMRALMLTLSGTERKQLTKQYTKSSEAYRFYLKGRYFWNKRVAPGLEKAREYFQQAIATDPNYALAYAGLADCYNMLSFFSGFAPAEAYQQARAAAARALALDDSLAEAQASMALVEMMTDWNWSGAEQRFQQALQLDPAYSPARQWYAKLLTALGRPEEALAEIRRAQEADPLSLIVGAILSFVYYYAGQYDEVIATSLKNLELDPHYSLTYWMLGWGYQQQGQYAAAIEAFEKAVTLSGNSTKMLSEKGYTQALAGQTHAAERTLRRLRQLAQKQYVSAYEIAIVLLGLGQQEEALIWLEKAAAEHCWEAAYFQVDPKLQSLRSAQPFMNLIQKIGLACPSGQLVPAGGWEKTGASDLTAFRERNPRGTRADTGLETHQSPL